MAIRRNPSKRGKPRVDFDLAELKALAGINCTIDEVAAVLGCSEKTVDRAIANRPEVREAWQAGKAEGRATLRRLQMAAAREGNPTMLIWLGKQLLGQQDRLEHSGPGGGPIEFISGFSAKKD